ncbi:hypothetical protein IAQ61_003555 [Plenodomus lingam]|nr:hypothetical protein IAQ61_003555 [Plenodomus lingam]
MSAQEVPHRPVLSALVTSSEDLAGPQASHNPLDKIGDDDLSVQTPGEPKDLIRVLDVHAGQGDSITCTLRTCSLHSPEAYETLSYVWGYGPKCKTIYMTQRKDMAVTQGLYDALVRLRHPTTSRTLWIDQLCIDQENMAEKNHQVNLMTKIYKNCTQCLIWFGEIPACLSVQSAQGVFDIITLLAENYTSPSSSPSSSCSSPPTSSSPSSSSSWLTISRTNSRTPSPSSSRSSSRSSSSSAFSQPTPPPIYIPPSIATRSLIDATQHAFHVFMSNPWWNRIWTVQEAVLPPTLLLHWGPLNIPWSTIVTASRAGWFEWPPPIHSFDMASFKPVVLGLDLTKEGETPLETLHRWRYRDALDPRDKVYALGGLLDPEYPIPSITNCDYTIDVATLYANVTLDLIEWVEGLECLVGLKMQRSSDLPSWAIDFRRCDLVNDGYAWWDPSFRYDWFNASGEVEWAEERMRCNGTVLSLQGVRVGVVEGVGEARICENVDNTEYEELLAQLSGSKALLGVYLSTESVDRTYPDDEISYQEAFWRTAIGDLVTDETPQRRATDEDVQLVARFLEDEDMDTEVVYSLRCMLMNHAFFLTREGYMGIGPTDIMPGDEVWILAGGSVPFVLRPTGLVDRSASSSPQYASGHMLVGGSYVHGFMDGEAEEVLIKNLIEVHLH